MYICTKLLELEVLDAGLLVLRYVREVDMLACFCPASFDAAHGFRSGLLHSNCRELGLQRLEQRDSLTDGVLPERRQLRTVGLLKLNLESRISSVLAHLVGTCQNDGQTMNVGVSLPVVLEPSCSILRLLQR